MKLSKVICGMAVIAAPMTLSAQVATDVGMGFGLMGGATFPTGNYKNISNTGFHAGAFLDLGRRVGPMGFRIDAMYHGFGDRDLVTTGNNSTQVTLSNKYSMMSGTGNLVLGIPLEMSAVRPYAIGGGGAYYVKNSPKCAGAGCGALLNVNDESDVKFGLNGGVGLEFGLGGANAFVESRYHHVFSGTPDVTCIGQEGCNRAAAKLIPLTLGVSVRW